MVEFHSRQAGWKERRREEGGTGLEGTDRNEMKGPYDQLVLVGVDVGSLRFNQREAQKRGEGLTKHLNNKEMDCASEEGLSTLYFPQNGKFPPSASNPNRKREVRSQALRVVNLTSLSCGGICIDSSKNDEVK